MDAKSIILNGGVIKIPYKTETKEWIDEAYIHLFVFYDKSKIIVFIPDVNFIPGGTKEYPVEKIDEAIKDYFDFVYRKENLAFKIKEAELELLKNGIFGDLDDDDYLELVIQKRQEILNLVS
jgi:hypothetical protein